MTNTKVSLPQLQTPRELHQLPMRDNSYDWSEISELYGIHVWAGAYRGILKNLTAINPYPDLPGVWLLIFEDAEAYRQVVWEMDTYAIVLDCPAHQSHFVIQWVEEVLKKPVGYVWFTRDIKSKPRTDKPFILSDSHMQVTFVHMKQSVHCIDYSYSLASPKCSTNSSTSVIFDADDANPTNGLLLNDQSLLFGALADYVRDRVPLHSM
ncbi:predicted protein [Verticillium alfalfae VaMs.102]|uniref:Predicted protein n=1 Tax=Verticillium alfalfae (strain VaMs.102 / ATCC MYA-4576 / FGSC 10136) TaxID=526221 RepID=C9SBV6_VERA1|nr:predicted protein [Verticillium alfalfae VaMs.102]EEY15840.1 predicted protein [Verticillium alfalfae VaMs.102]